MIFDTCFTWNWTTRDNGYFQLISYPSVGGAMQQYNHILQILDIIKSEARIIILQSIKKK